LKSIVSSIREIARPRRPEGYAVIRLLCGGICNTDLELLQGYYGFSGISRARIVGEVVDASANPRLLAGALLEKSISRAACELVQARLLAGTAQRAGFGHRRHAGAFESLLTLPEANLHLVPITVSDETACSWKPLAAACEILEQASLPRNAEVAVLGDGKLGLLVAQVLPRYRSSRAPIWPS
jgi:alcohol dehydrogenase